VQEHCPSPKCPVFSNMRRLAGFALRSFFMVLRCFSLITFRHKRNQSRNVSSAQSGGAEVHAAEEAKHSYAKLPAPVERRTMDDERFWNSSNFAFTSFISQ